MRRLFVLLTVAACSSSATPPPVSGPTPGAARVTGHVFGPAGPLAGARVAIGARTATSGGDGSFLLDGVPEGGALLTAAAAGHHDGAVAVRVARPQAAVEVTLDSADTVLLAFTGDVAFTGGERVWPTDSAGFRGLVADVAPLVRGADLAVLGLESVLADPGAPHPSRPVLLASPPASRAALEALGADVVVLANDHTYDYLDEGLTDTIAALREARITPLGAGADDKQAYATVVAERNGVSVGLAAFSALTGHAEEMLVPEPPFFDAAPQRPGVARLDIQRLDVAIASLRARADRTVVVLHGGREHSLEPAVNIATAAHHAIDSGADLVVADHPRPIQGVEAYRGKLIFYSLGAFAFTDAEPSGWGGVVLRVALPRVGPPTARLDPVFVDGGVPYPAAGDLRAALLATVAERSAALGATVLADGRVLAQPPSSLPSSDAELTRDEPTVSGEGAHADLRDELGPDQYLAEVAVLDPPASTLWLGRDVLVGGDFEDELADGRYGAPTGFRLPSDAEQVIAGGAGGGLALGICRSSSTRQVASAESAGRYPLDGESAVVSLCGCWRGDAGATAAAKVLFFDNLEDAAGPDDTVALVSGEPPRDWECFCHAAVGPRSARYAAVRVEHTPTADHTACVAFDSLRLVQWQAQPGSSATLPLPNRVRFVRVTGVGSAAAASLSYRVRTLEAP